jgi:hypothetical protein
MARNDISLIDFPTSSYAVSRHIGRASRRRSGNDPTVIAASITSQFWCIAFDDKTARSFPYHRLFIFSTKPADTKQVICFASRRANSSFFLYCFRPSALRCYISITICGVIYLICSAFQSHRGFKRGQVEAMHYTLVFSFPLPNFRLAYMISFTIDHSGFGVLRAARARAVP